jgi:ABC-type oligopeptide transport system substrate-binding subunit
MAVFTLRPAVARIAVTLMLAGAVVAVTPAAAEKVLRIANLGEPDWSVSPDGPTYTFHLRGNAKWSNGEPVTADDFVYSLRRVEDPKVNSQYAEVLYPIRNAEEVNTGKAELTALGVKAPDPASVEITLRAPTPYFLQLLTHTTALPVNAKTVAQFGAEWLRPGKMVSSRKTGCTSGEAFFLDNGIAQAHAADPGSPKTATIAVLQRSTVPAKSGRA